VTDPVVIHWFRRDLRLTDNLALHAALSSGSRVVSLFILDPAILNSPRTGTPRLAFLFNALAALDKSLRQRGSRLLLRQGDPKTVLPALAHELNARAVYFNRDYSPFARQRDEAVQKALPIPVFGFDDALLRAPDQVLKDDGTPYTVYTPFQKRWRALSDPLPPLNPAQGVFAPLDDIPEPQADLAVASPVFLPGATENAAHALLARFVAGPIYAYDTARHRLSGDPFSGEEPQTTSGLSPYLRVGLLSPRQAYWAAYSASSADPNEAARRSVTTWINELIWREFYMHILVHFPHVDRANFRPEYDDVLWRNAPDDLRAWQTGMTGYPVVDAAMRQLVQTGWMPNRARMIVASFLTKDLLIHWQEGERFFMQWLIDGDPAANNGGWQWTAGTGTDAQPYFRIFHPVLQSQKYNPDGTYIRRWVPELREVPGQFIHAPWQMDHPPAHYPPPILDHAAARARTLAAFQAIKR
jgi:deoxyribodipyrimidine photo-lyase